MLGRAQPDAERPPSEPSPTRSATRRHDGHRLLWLLGPHLVLGLWLLIVPADTLSRCTEVALLAHGLGSLAVLPLLVSHWQRQRRRLDPGRRSHAWLAAAATSMAAASGVAAAWFGDAYDAGRTHAWVDAVRAPPAFAYKVRPVGLDDDAAWCGECHTVQHLAWSRPQHAHVTPNFGAVLRGNKTPRVTRDLSQVPGIARHELRATRHGAELTESDVAVSSSGIGHTFPSEDGTLPCGRHPVRSTSPPPISQCSADPAGAPPAAVVPSAARTCRRSRRASTRFARATVRWPKLPRCASS